MRVVVALLCLAVFAAGENCHEDGDCTLTVCSGTTRVDCYHDHGSDVRLCTCVPRDGDHQPCSSPNDCSGQHGDCGHHGHVWHCVDQRCRCF